MARPRRSSAGRLASSVAIVAATILFGAPPSAAEDVTTAEAAALAGAAAEGDAGALSDLREVTAIDGRPADLDPVLSVDAADRRARLENLAAAWSEVDPEDQPPAGGTASPTEDRAVAEAVLSADKFHEPELPRPFRSPLRWLGERIIGVWDRVVSLLSPVLGTRGAALLLVAAFGASLVGVLATVIRRRSAAPRRGTGRSGPLLVDLDLDPDDLDRRADSARRSGDLAAAVRLRYEAGLLRLVDGGRLVLRPDTTASGAAEQVGSPTMDTLTETFEEIVYGGRPATADDDDAAADGWRRLLGEQVRR